MLDELSGQANQDSASSEPEADSALMVDSSSTLDEGTNIDAAADAFVESDEGLNEQIRKESEKKLPVKSGYPYVDWNKVTIFSPKYIQCRFI